METDTFWKEIYNSTWKSNFKYKHSKFSALGQNFHVEKNIVRVWFKRAVVRHQWQAIAGQHFFNYLSQHCTFHNIKTFQIYPTRLKLNLQTFPGLRKIRYFKTQGTHMPHSLSEHIYDYFFPMRPSAGWKIVLFPLSR